MSQNELWQQFKQPLVRQLAFCVGSPNLLNHYPYELNVVHHFDFHENIQWQQQLINYLPRLTYLDQHPHSLEIFLHQLKSTRLGLRFEMFLWFWLLDRDYHAYHLLGHSLQQIQGAKTLGELDFLILNQDSKQIEHWEVALKYYLGEADLSLQHWYGLNRSDTLKRKLQHFSQKQFQFKHALGYEIQQRFCVLKGQLYLPLHHQCNNLPTWINPQRQLGIWSDQIPINSEKYDRLQRNEWIYPQQKVSSLATKWWTDGLYHRVENQQFYMYRNPKLTVFTYPYVSA